MDMKTTIRLKEKNNRITNLTPNGYEKKELYEIHTVKKRKIYVIIKPIPLSFVC